MVSTVHGGDINFIPGYYLHYVKILVRYKIIYRRIFNVILIQFIDMLLLLLTYVLFYIKTIFPIISHNFEILLYRLLSSTLLNFLLLQKGNSVQIRQNIWAEGVMFTTVTGCSNPSRGDKI